MNIYYPSGKIYDRDSLDRDQINNVEREQFQGLNAAWHKLYVDFKSQIEDELDSDDEQFKYSDERADFGGMKVGCQTRFHYIKENFKALVHMEVFEIDVRGEVQSLTTGRTIMPSMLDDYTMVAVEYANRVRREAAEAAAIAVKVTARKAKLQSKISKDGSSQPRSQSPEQQRSRSPEAGEKPKSYLERDDGPSSSSGPSSSQPGPTSSLTNIPSCLLISNKIFSKWESANFDERPSKCRKLIKKFLEAQGLHRSAMIQLDYILVPYLLGEKHFILLGIAPKQRFFFVIDSVHHFGVYHMMSSPLHTLNQFAMLALPRDFQDECPWPVYTQWTKRYSEKDDGSPAASRQTDAYNCGVFVATNVCCLAWGYDLLCYNESDLNPGKRPRMFCELWDCGEFRAPFNYDLFTMPGILREKDPNLADVRPLDEENNGMMRVPDSSIQSDWASDLPTIGGYSEGGVSTPWPSDNDVPGRRYGEAAETEGCERPGTNIGESNAMDNVGDMGIDREITELESSEDTEMEQFGFVDSDVEEDDDPTPYPRQFSRSIFIRRGFWYMPDGAEKAYWDGLATREELVAACEERGVEGYEPWSGEKKRVFRRWIVNYCTASKVLQKGEYPKPVKGMGSADLKPIPK